ncbi:cytochrome P450 [Mytilinidion resinicola]|uniref:Cytochrome P450 n=1 Tax=Mytilinidion resinicola TaxID=574789 RepID=A0A6A6YVC5_9PEZI|nr:cytochrome P450 [Mytilinidion resinicola]KAF2812906.1 cytochrome P450 [Mytilinidion resinicola]
MPSTDYGTQYRMPTASLTYNKTSIPSIFSGLVEDNGIISIEAEHYTSFMPASDLNYTTLLGYYRTLSATTVSDPVAPIPYYLDGLNTTPPRPRAYVVQIDDFDPQRRVYITDQPAEARIKYPLKDHFFGIDLILDTIRNAKNHRHLEGTWHRYEKFGNTFTSRLINCHTVFTIDPENIKTILATKFEDFKLSTIRVDAMVPIFGHGIFTTDGKARQHSRALLRPTFAKESISNFDTAECHFQHLLLCIPKNGATVDLQELFFRYTMDTATEFLFGHSVHSQTRARESIAANAEAPDAEFVTHYAYTQLEASHNVRLGPLNKFHYNAKANLARDKVFAYVDGLIDALFEKRAATLTLPQKEEMVDNDTGTKEKYIFLDALANETSDRQVLRDQILNFLLAGRDTTASLLSNLFFELARRPDVWAKLREKVKALEGRLPTYTDLRNMKYLKWCIDESLRLRPVVPANTREAIRDTFLPRGGGADGNAPLFVKKGTQVLYSVYSMHRRRDFFGDNSEEFRPERWEGLQPRWEYLPFNGGPRICLGQQFALTEASFVVVRLLQEFAGIEARDEEPWMELYTLVVCSKNGVQVGLARAERE